MAGHPPKKVGGEVGDVRANIDQDKLNEYLQAHVPAVRAPVSIKQFKVNTSDPARKMQAHRHPVWPGMHVDGVLV